MECGNRLQSVQPYKKIEQKKKGHIVEKDNTSSYNATESSEEIDINYEEASTSQNEEFVVFSNDKENTEIINMQDALETLNASHALLIDNSDILLSTTLLSKTYEVILIL